VLNGAVELTKHRGIVCTQSDVSIGDILTITNCAQGVYENSQDKINVMCFYFFNNLEGLTQTLKQSITDHKFFSRNPLSHPLRHLFKKSEPLLLLAPIVPNSMTACATASWS